MGDPNPYGLVDALEEWLVTPSRAHRWLIVFAPAVAAVIVLGILWAAARFAAGRD